MVVDTVNQLPCFKDLIAVLFECLLIIALGYLSCRFRLISSQAKDLNSYLATFALPMIIFLNIAQMEFQTLNLSFLFCMLAAKLLIFIAVTLLTLAISYPRNYGYAGALAILATQSNDFALGYPLITSLYGDDHKREMLNYLSLQAPIQLLVLNPLGIAMLEYERSRQVRIAKTRRKSEVSMMHEQQRSLSKQLTAICDYCSSNEASQRDENGNTIIASRLTATNNTGIMQQVTIYADEPRVSRNLKNLKLTMLASLEAPNNQVGREAKLQSDGQPRSRTISIVSLTDPPLDKKISTIDEHETSSRRQVCAIGQSAQRCTCFANHALPSERNEATDSNRFAVKILIKQFKSTLPIDCGFIKALAKNPLIIASVVALTVNLTNGPDLPKFVTRVSHTIAASFASPALFVIGLSMFGKFELLIKNRNDLLLSCGLVMTKLLLLPNLMRTITLNVLPMYSSAEDASKLVEFSYLYGSLPTAPTAVVIAQQYDVLTNVVSISMLLSTVASAPLLLGSAVLINQAGNISETAFERFLNRTEASASLIALIFLMLTVFSFFKFKKVFSYINFNNLQDAAVRQSVDCESARVGPTHRLLLLLAISQIIVCIGGLLSVQHSFSTPDATSPASDLVSSDEILCAVQFSISTVGLVMSRFVMLALIMSISANRFIGNHIANKISWIAIQVYGVMVSCLVVWLALTANDSPCKASEASIPTSQGCLFIRLAYDSIILAVSIPLFALILRSDSKLNYVRSNPSKSFLERSGSEVNDRYVISSSSISSETNSNITTNTNLEVIIGHHQSINKVFASEVDQDSSSFGRHEATRARQNNDERAFTSVKRILPNLVELDDPNQVTHTGSLSTDSDISIRNNNNGDNYVDRRDVSQQINLERCEYEEASTATIEDLNHNIHTATLATQDKSSDHRKLPFGDLDNSRFSILIVFLIMNAMLNLTSIVQKLLGDQMYGTFKQIEVINVAMEFGQGLLTLTVYGIKQLRLAS